MIGSCPEDSNRHRFSNMAQYTLHSRPHSHLSACLFGSLSIICNAWPTTSLTVPPHALGLKTRTRTFKPSGKQIHMCLRSPWHRAKASQQSLLWLRHCKGMCVCVSLGGWVCVISVVLNDSCSICYWVALLKISQGFNAKSELRSWKAVRLRGGWWAEGGAARTRL